MYHGSCMQVSQSKELEISLTLCTLLLTHKSMSWYKLSFYRLARHVKAQNSLEHTAIPWNENWKYMLMYFENTRHFYSFYLFCNIFWFVEENECKLCHYSQGSCVPFNPNTVSAYQVQCDVSTNRCKTTNGDTIVKYTAENLNQGVTRDSVILVDSSCRNGGLCDQEVGSNVTDV